MRKSKLIGLAASAMTIALALGGLTACVEEDIEQHEHEYTKWEHDATQHWKVCEEDGAESERVDHFFNPEEDYVCECGAEHTHVLVWKHNSEITGKNVKMGTKPVRKHIRSMTTVNVCAAKRLR